MKMVSQSSSDELSLLSNSYKALYTLRLARIGFVSLIVYDVALCFPTELHYIWRTRWSSGKLLYISCRYSTLLYLVAFTIDYQFMVDCPLGVTKAFNNIEYWMSILINVPFQALVAVRTYALFDRSRLIKWIIIILFTVHFLVVISMGVPYSKDITSNTGYAMLPFSNTPCSFEFQKDPIDLIVTVYAVHAVYDTVLWGMLVFKVYQAFTTGRTRLIGVIFRLGLLYFALVTSLYIVCTVLYVKIPQTNVAIPTIVSHLVQVMQSVLSARFLLQLHTYLNDLSIQSISISPEHVLRIEEEMKFARVSAMDESSETLEAP